MPNKNPQKMVYGNVVSNYLLKSVKPLAVLSVIISLSACIKIQAGEKKILFKEDFSGDLSAWKIGGNAGKIENNTLTFSGAPKQPNNLWIKNGLKWTNYTIEFDLSIKRGTAQWMLRYQPGRFYYFSLSPKTFSRVVVLKRNWLPGGEIKLKKPFEYGKWVHVKIEAYGNTIVTWLNGEKLDEWHSQSFSKGSFGFSACTIGSCMSLKNVKVYYQAPAPKDISSTRKLATSFCRIPYTFKKPVIDGVISKQEWKNAAVLSPFHNINSFLSSKKTNVKVMWDDQNLYLAFSSQKIFEHNLEEKKLPRDGRVFFFDCSEIAIAPPNSKRWFKFAFDRNATKWDKQYIGNSIQKEEWNPEWEIKSRLIHDRYFVKDKWNVEVKIPFKSIPVPKPVDGSSWRVQITRNYDQLEKIKYPMFERWTCWSPPFRGDYNTPSDFGTFKFVRNKGILQFKDFQDIGKGMAGFTGRIYPGTDKAEGSIHVFNNMKSFFNASAPSTSSGEISIAKVIKVGEETDMVQNWQVSDKDGVIASGAVKVRVHPSFSVIYAPLFTEKKIVVKGDLSKILDRPDKTVIIAEIMDKNGTVVEKKIHSVKANENTFKVELSLAAVNSTSCNIRIRMTNPEGKVLEESRKNLKIPARPPWEGCKLADLKHVPYGWEPVRTSKNADGITLDTYAKQYKFSSGLMPDKIIIRGKPFLAAPISLNIISNGNKEIFKATTKSKVTKSSSLGTTILWQGESKNLKAQAEIRVEFDGLIWYKLSFTPKKLPLQIDKVNLLMPIKSPGLRYMRGYAQKTPSALIGEAKLDYEYPEMETARYFAFSSKGWIFGKNPYPFYWIGGEDYGLFTIIPSLRNMKVKNDYSKLSESKKTTYFTINFIDTPVTWNKEINYQFGFIGTPTRALKNHNRLRRAGWSCLHDLDQCMKKARNGRIGKPFFIGPEARPLKKGEVTAKMIHGSPLVVHGNPYPDSKDIKSISEQADWAHKALGMKAVLWLDMTYTPITLPKAYPYRYEWERFPVDRWNRDGEACTHICPKNPSWSDYYLYGAKQLIEKTGIDGFYLDMTGFEYCSNEFHGCGYNDGGKRKPEIAFLECRRLYLGLYNLVHTMCPDGLVLQHSRTTSPTCLWTDVVTHGEEWDNAKSYRTLSMPFYQSYYMVDKQYGVTMNWFPVQNYICYRGTIDKMSTLEEELGLSLIHGDTPFPIEGSSLLGLVCVWNAMRDFGADQKETEWVPYWRSGLGEWKHGIAASVYKRNNKQLLVLFNTAYNKNIFNLKTFQGKPIYDVVAGKNISAKEITLKPRDFKLLWVGKR